MECQICNSETKINWGNANIILCESHSNELEKLQKENLPSNKNKNNDAKLGTAAKIILIVICLSLAAFSWTGVIIFGGFSFIPLSLIIASIYILFKLMSVAFNKNLNPMPESVAALRDNFVAVPD